MWVICDPNMGGIVDGLDRVYVCAEKVWRFIMFLEIRAGAGY